MHTQNGGAFGGALTREAAAHVIVSIPIRPRQQAE
jgi:hypothetical protein